MRVLFVCGGNTCRSPMAVAIIRALFPTVHAESAGIAPHGSGVTADTQGVVSDLYGIDLTAHHPRDVRDVRLSDFDLVVTMEPYIGRELQDTHPNIIQWSVVDPYLKGRQAYERCACQLEQLIRGLVNTGKEVM